ncbi:MAG: hypothetical protein SGI77_22005 [Pirellulaceae bacterium]|nr:hypothetical protein [Pirellulaceae bacterium]
MNNESEMHLEAMLYLLDDPALDRTAFEARLADDVQLCAILADAVEMHSALKALAFASIPMSLFAPRTNGESQVTLDFSSSTRHFRGATDDQRRDQNRRIAYAAIAASVLFAAAFGWQALRSSSLLQPVQIANTSDSIPSQSTVSTMLDATLWNSVVWAWGEIRTSDHDEMLNQHSHFLDYESALATREPFGESDVPEWLVTATAAVYSDGDGAESRLDQIDARTLVQ